MGKEDFEGMYQLRRIGQVGIKGLLIVLPKDGAVWGLEEGCCRGGSLSQICGALRVSRSSWISFASQ